MEDRTETSLSHLLHGVKLHGQDRIDLADRSTETTLEIVSRLSQAAKLFNIFAISEYGGRSGPVREEGIVEQVVGAAFQSFGGIDPHPDSFEKAAMILRGITQGHPFTDGNKRTGFVTAVYFLEQAGLGFPSDYTEDDIVDLCLKVSSGDIRDIEKISQQLRSYWQLPIQSTPAA